MARLFGVIVALCVAGLMVLASFAYSNMDANMSLPTGGVTDAGPADAVPTGASADKALAERARLQAWRGKTGPAPDEPAAAASPRKLDAQPAATTAPHTQPWVDAAAPDISLYRDRSYVHGITSLPDPKAGTLIQERGREWRRFHNGDLSIGAGMAVLGVLGLLGLFLALRGRVRVSEGFSGVWIPRFDGFERFNHWMTATSFVLLALSGVLLLYGQFFLRPWIGAEAYSTVLYYNVLAHIGFAVPFVIGVTAMIVLWVRQNGITRVDLHWLKKGGGMIMKTKEHLHAYRFNAGQKIIFWLVVAGAVVMTASGITLIFPFFWFGMPSMQATLLFHALAGLAMIALIFGHIYIGTIGMEGAFDAMWSGEVDRNWALEHHDLWVAESAEPRGRSQAGPFPAE